MPWSDYSKKLEANRRYAQTPAGKAARARSHQRYIEKRRAGRAVKFNTHPLADAMAAWSIR